MTRWNLLRVCSLAGLVVIGGAGDALAQNARANAPSGTTDVDGTPALHRAVYNEDLDTVRRLLQSGANANAANRYGVTPLLLAGTNGNPALIDALLASGADANLASPEGETPLMLAARTGNTAAVNTLIARGANVNAKEKWKGQTALMWAAAEGHAHLIGPLVDAGANVQERSNGRLTALLFAVREGKASTVTALLAKGANVNDTFVPVPRRGAAPTVAPTVGGPSALVLAVTNAHFELAAMLLDAGADPNAAAQGWTALHELSWVRKPGDGSNQPAPPGSGAMGSLDIVRKLVARGADVNARVTRAPASLVMTHLNLKGGTPFFLAARTGDTEFMQLLVDLGADPLIGNEDDTTPLMAAAGLGTRSAGEDAGKESEALAAVRLALDLGNDPNAIDKKGNTAMHGAAMKEMPSVVKFLNERGAKVDIWNRKNALGWTPLRIAAGVYRSDNFRFSVPTAQALREAMSAAGVSTELEAPSTITGATRPNN